MRAMLILGLLLFGACSIPNEVRVRVPCRNTVVYFYRPGTTPPQLDSIVAVMDSVSCPR